MGGKNKTDFSSDILIIGSGIAGLSFALKAAEYAQVIVITKREMTASNTFYAQGGLAAVLSPEDSFQDHINDTINCGNGLCNRAVVEKVIQAAPTSIKNLLDLGAKFNRMENGELDLTIEGGHSKPRVVHAGDMTGKEVELVLLNAATKHPSISIFENQIAINLVVKNNSCLGCYVLDTESLEIQNFAAKIIVLATGGIGHIFAHTTNQPIATGDGIAMAYRAGAIIMNMEFTQFHPTTLHHPLAESFLISESLRGEGAILINKNGQRFMSNYHPKMELAPRDIVARAIDNELKKSGDDCVYLDISMKNPDFIRKRFPGIYMKSLSYNIDITKEAIPVVPAAHYCCGGVKATIAGETDIKKLLAIGEVACTGLHGANRLASNSLIEGLVCANFAAEKCKTIIEKHKAIPSFPPWELGEAADSDEMIVVTHNRDEIRRLMWNYVGIVRSNKRLKRAKNRIDLLKREINQYYWDFVITSDLVELRNMVLVAELVIDSALTRKESRGIHYSLDYPNKLPFAHNTFIKLTK